MQVVISISEHRAQKMRMESVSDEIKKRKRCKKMVKKMFTNDEGEMGEIFCIGL
jgi:hypothetical protein